MLKQLNLVPFDSNPMTLTPSIQKQRQLSQSEKIHSIIFLNPRKSSSIRRLPRRGNLRTTAVFRVMNATPLNLFAMIRMVMQQAVRPIQLFRQ